jgi:hypothetical protein
MPGGTEESFGAKIRTQPPDYVAGVTAARSQHSVRPYPEALQSTPNLREQNSVA